MTNEVFQINWPTSKENVSRKVLFRIYGEGVKVFFDRDDEIQTFEFVSSHGQGPRLLGRFPNGRIEEFINARTLLASDLRDPDTSARVAAKMREFHDLDIPGPKKSVVWDRLRKWLQTAKNMATPEEADAVRLDAIKHEVSILEMALSNGQHIGFCHNDLQYGNIMMDEETRTLTIICIRASLLLSSQYIAVQVLRDYEYSSYDPIASDIANHFCEMAADYHAQANYNICSFLFVYFLLPVYFCNLSLLALTALDERRSFVHAYLSHSGDAEVEKLLEDVKKHTFASHLFWGLWGIISEHVNKIDYDYMEHARQGFQRYWLTRPALPDSLSSLGSVVVSGI